VARTRKEIDLKRINNHTLRFNNRELKAIKRYCKKYKITNRSKFMREAIITEILKQFDKDYPSLFDDQPNLFTENH